MINPIFTNLFLLPATVAGIISCVSTPLVIKIANKIGIIDDPAKNKHPKVIHTYPVPRGGGLAIFFGVLVASLIFLPPDKHLLGILAGATLVTVMGILDDKYNLNPYLRILIGILAAAMPVLAGIGIAFIKSPIIGIIDLSQPQFIFQFLGTTHSLWIFSDIFGLFWIVFMMNMLNMGAKGVDGQLPGVAAISALVIAILSLRFSADITQWPVTILAAITFGSFLGFLPWNFYPQKIMPSYGGATLAGFLLAILSILSTTKVGILVVTLGVPLIDTGYTIVRRILSGQSPIWGDRGHLHHRLLDIGWSKRKVTYFYWAITAALGLMAINLNTSTKFYTIIGVAFLVGGMILWLTYKSKSKVS